LAEALVSLNNDMCVIIGAKQKSRILCESDFRRAGAEVLVATEDGSKGHKGLATDLLKTVLDRCRAGRESAGSAIYACGPNGMLKAVMAIAERGRIKCQISLEERMACGVGVCLGCPVKVRAAKRPDGKTMAQPGHAYKMVCKNGPVFNAEEVIL
jgi:dihydroorotate dehydrogenase electron transfer subunit